METPTQSVYWVYNPEPRIYQMPYYLADEGPEKRDRERDKFPQVKQVAIESFTPGFNGKTEAQLVNCGLQTGGHLRLVNLGDLDAMLAAEMFRNTTSVRALLQIRLELVKLQAEHPHLGQVVFALDAALKEKAEYKPEPEGDA